MWWVVGLVLVVVVAAGLVVARRGRGRAGVQPPEPQAPIAPPVAAPPVVAAAPATRPEPPAAAPPPVTPSPVVPPRSAAARVPAPAAPIEPAAPAPKAAAAERVVERPPVRPALPRVPRFELRDTRPEPVLIVERADEAAWQASTELPSTPVQRELLAGLLVQAPQLDGAPAAGPGLYAVRLRAASALPIARGEIAAATLTAMPSGAIDTDAAADFAAALLALHAARRALPELRAQVGETKAVTAALHPKLVALTEGRVKTLVQDLGRYLREAEENFAGAIRKPVFLDRIAQACTQAAALGAGLRPQAQATRAALQAQAQAPRFGEVQLERSVAALRDMQGQRRLDDVAARLLSGWEQLRGVLAPGKASAATLDEAAQALHDAIAADRTLVATLSRCLDEAKAPDYVGKAEFNANLSAAREILAGFEKDTLDAAAASLVRARAEFGVARVDDAPLALLLQLDAQARVVAVREPISPAAR